MGIFVSQGRRMMTMSASGRYANEKIESKHTYPEWYKGPRPIEEQIKALARTFLLSPDRALEYAKKVLPARTFPDCCEGPFAIASHHALARRFFPGVRDEKEKFSRAASLILRKIGESRRFYAFCEGKPTQDSFLDLREVKLTPDRFRPDVKTECALEILAKEQRGDIWIVGAQFGKRHAGKSVRLAREDMSGPEFGAHTVAAGSMLLTHQVRLISFEDLWFSLPGEEFDLRRDGSFGHAPYFHFLDGEVKFDTLSVCRPYEFCGSVSLFLPARR